MMHEGSIGSLLSRAVFRHHDDPGHDTLKQHDTLKPLRTDVAKKGHLSSFIVMMHQCSPGEYLASAALMHHAEPSGVSRPSRVGMMLECNTGKSLTRAAFMHHDDQGHA